MGAILIALVAGVLVVDRRLAPHYPFLLVLVMTLAGIACWELVQLLDLPRQTASVCFAGVYAVLAVNWLPVWFEGSQELHVWPCLAGTFAGIVLLAFIVEMATFREAGGSMIRIAMTILVVGYLGLLATFFVRLRWDTAVDTMPIADAGTLALALAVFVPKCGDIGAYFTGRLLGRHPMAPILSPKKTWEGAAGGMALAVAACIAINRFGPLLSPGWSEIGFGITVGLAGLLGDLAESLIKRDCRRKDASDVVPGFGGVLDVIDAILFAAPVAYCWLGNFHS
jgi:phosphatidate cytidylyltransferase